MECQAFGIRPAIKPQGPSHRQKFLGGFYKVLTINSQLMYLLISLISLILDFLSIENAQLYN